MMKSANEQRVPLLDFEALEDTSTEPDLDSTTFFPNKEYSEGRELSYSQKVERINALLLRNTLNRPTLFRILATVGSSESSSLGFFELETIILSMPEFSKATQPPGSLIEWLADVEALTLREIDDKGNVITEEDREGKTEDEIDDLIYDYLVSLTEYGKESLATFNPADRLADVCSDKPQRMNTYIELLTFFKQKRSYLDVDRFLRGNPILMDGRKPEERPMQPSVFVDKLAASGAIVFDEGWLITPEGLHFLESI